MIGIPYDHQSVEVMAPAGTFEALRAAIAGGADAVYFGVGNLNMRSHSARNFEIGDLPLIARYCRFCGVKSYLTLNTIIYDQEISQSQVLVDAAAEAGISAIIASDQSILDYARDRGVPLHLSTQLNISNFETVRFYAKYADVMVLARELTLEQIAGITAKIGSAGIKGPSGKPVALELFVHGALCMAVSGKCYLSLHQYNTSANRGKCLQACRRAYRVEDIESGDQLEIDQEYIMSPKDLNIPFSIGDGRVKTSPFTVELGDTKLNLSGSTGLDKTIDYALKVTLPEKLARNGITSLEGTIGGTFTSPKIKLDASALAKQAVAGLADKLLGKTTTDSAGVKTTVSAKENITAKAEEIRATAKAAGDKLIAEAEKQGAALVEKAQCRPMAEHDGVAEVLALGRFKPGAQAVGYVG